MNLFPLLTVLNLGITFIKSRSHWNFTLFEIIWVTTTNCKTSLPTFKKLFPLCKTCHFKNPLLSQLQIMNFIGMLNNWSPSFYTNGFSKPVLIVSNLGRIFTKKPFSLKLHTIWAYLDDNHKLQNFSSHL